MSGDRITIGKFSSLTYLSQRALRLYDRKGILVPGVRDRITGYRYYNHPDRDGIKDQDTLQPRFRALGYCGHPVGTRCR